MRRRIEEVFALDIRSLALFRIALGANLLFDLAIRSLTLKQFYTDWGLLPRSNLMVQLHDPWIWSIHFLGGTVLSQAILFLIAGFFAVGLLIGYRTRWMTFVSWFLLSSLHNRLPYIQNSGDVYLRMSLFWSCFIPLGACWSVDRALSGLGTKVPARIASWGTFALLMQTVIVYGTTSACKFFGSDWLKTGQAVYYVLHLEIFATPVAHALLMWPHVLRPLTYLVMFYEAIGGLLLLCPFWIGPLRTAVIFGFFLMHISFGLCLRVDPFPRISVIELLPFLPGWFWSSLAPWTGRLLRWQPFWQKRLMKMPRRPLWTELSWWESGGVAGALFLVIYGVLTTFQPRPVPLPRLPAALEAATTILDLHQAWGMFAPEIGRQSGWMVVPGRLMDGRTVDLYRGGAPVRWAPPPSISADFETERWRRYFSQLMGGDRNRLNEYGQYLCRSWNASHMYGDQLMSLSIVMMADTALPDYQIELAHPVTLWRTACFTPSAPSGPVLPVQEKHPRRKGRPPMLVMPVAFVP